MPKTRRSSKKKAFERHHPSNATLARLQKGEPGWRTDACDGIIKEVKHLGVLGDLHQFKVGDQDHRLITLSLEEIENEIFFDHPDGLMHYDRIESHSKDGRYLTVLLYTGSRAKVTTRSMWNTDPASTRMYGEAAACIDLLAPWIPRGLDTSEILCDPNVDYLQVSGYICKCNTMIVILSRQHTNGATVSAGGPVLNMWALNLQPFCSHTTIDFTASRIHSMGGIMKRKEGSRYDWTVGVSLAFSHMNPTVDNPRQHLQKYLHVVAKSIETLSTTTNILQQPIKTCVLDTPESKFRTVTISQVVDAASVKRIISNYHPSKSSLEALLNDQHLLSRYFVPSRFGRSVVQEMIQSEMFLNESCNTPCQISTDPMPPLHENSFSPFSISPIEFFPGEHI